MSEIISAHISEVEAMKEYPLAIYYKGHIDILKNRKISVVGTRRPNIYTKLFTHKLSNELSKRGVTIVSGAAMGVDAIAHKAVLNTNTIAVVANGLDIRYPKVNKQLIAQIEENGLMLSLFEDGYEARAYSFVQRNELVVALGEVLIVTQADLNSGSLRSVEFAIKQNKRIYVLPHRLDESLGTQELLKNNLATPIYSIDSFLKELSIENIDSNSSDEVLVFCQSNPTYTEAITKFGEKIFQYELESKISVQNDRIIVL